MSWVFGRSILGGDMNVMRVVVTASAKAASDKREWMT
jgi:hypothetical protein